MGKKSLATSYDFFVIHFLLVVFSLTIFHETPNDVRSLIRYNIVFSSSRNVIIIDTAEVLLSFRFLSDNTIDYMTVFLS